MKIYWLCPDITFPSGGPQVIYQFSNILNELNYDSYILHTQRDFKLDFIDYSELNNLKFRYLEDTLTFNEDDILLIPEPDVELMKLFKDIKCKKIVFNQNWAYTYGGFLKLQEPNVNKYQHLNINNVLTVSHVIKEYLEYSMNINKDLNIQVVSNYIHDRFQAKELNLKKVQIAFMPRKNGVNATEIFAILNSRGINLPIVPINNMTQKQVANVLSESAIFLNFGYPEGFCLPALEAMKSGCIVIGYHGQGGLEYMIGETNKENMNMFVFNDGNILQMTQQIEFVLNNLLNQKFEDFNKITANAIKTANSYNKQQTKDMLEKTFKIFSEKL